MSKFYRIQHGRSLSFFTVLCSRPTNAAIMTSRRTISQSTTHSIPEKTFNSSPGKHVSLDTGENGTCPSTLNNSLDFKRLSEEEKEIYNLHREACQKGEDMYKDPVTGYAVFTEVFHRQRNSCCGNACRHCPYNHESVPASKRTKKFNSAFYY